MDIKFTLSPSAYDIDFLTQKINEEAKSQGIMEEAYPFGLFLHNDEGEIVAGANGSVVYGTIYTDQLWIHPHHRGLGLGRLMMEKIHHYGLLQRCSLATVATLDFQKARSFYEHMGYECDFERSGYIHGSSCVFLKKILTLDPE